MDELTLRHYHVPPDHYDRGIKNNFLQGLWHKNRFAEVKRVLDGIKPRQILDIGCHGGTFTEVIARKFPQAETFAIDISFQAIDYAKKTKPGIDFRVAEATNLPFADNSFDLITCFDVLEHLPDPEKALAQMAHVLRSGGEAIFLIPVENLLFKSVWFFWTHFGSGRVWQETHVQNFNGRRLDKILEKSGFEIKTRKIINWGMYLLIKVGKKRK